MIANALLVATVLAIATLFALMDSLSFLIPYRALLWTQYGTTLLLWGGLAFANLAALCVVISRAFFLKTTGEKLAHLEKQLRTGSPLSKELAARLREEA